MGIQLTPQEMQLVKEGKLDIRKIEEHRKNNPVRAVDLNELDKIKEEIRIANQEYRDSINKNKELYNELVKNRAEKERCRNKITELRKKKKKIMGLI